MTEAVDSFDECSVSDSLKSIAELMHAHREDSQEALSLQQDRLQGIESKLVTELTRICGSLNDWQSVFGEIEQWQQDVEQQQQETDAARSEVEELRIKTQRQRRKLAEKLVTRRSSHEAHTAEIIAGLEAQIKDLQNEIDDADIPGMDAKVASLTQLLAEEQARSKRLEADARAARDELVESRSESGSLRQQVARGRMLLDERNGQLKSLQVEIDRLSADQSAEDESAHQERERLREECEYLRQRVDELEVALRQSENREEDELADLRSKYEVAIENVRSLKHRNEELEQELATSNAPMPTSSFDWESQKEALMKSLNGDSPAEEDHESLAKLENTVKMTDKVIAQKDQEIADLRASLQALQLAEKEPEPEPDAKETLLSADEVISRGRTEIEQLKHEWREKLRVAEVDISVERAQNARARAELEEKMRDLEAQLALAKKQAALGSTEKPAKRWFRR